MSDLRVSGLSKRFGQTAALVDVSLFALSSSRTAVVGPSGSGKSTLLRLIAGFERPDEGEIMLGEDHLARGRSIVPAHLRNIGIVSQDGALFPHLDVAQNIAFGMEKSADRHALVLKALDMVKLDRALVERRPHELSGGQQQRVALARALARKPRLMLLDEPFSALDAGLRHSVRNEVMQTLDEVGIGSILVTHDHAEALSFADQIAVMRNGRLVQAGAPRDLYLRPADPETAIMLGHAIILPARIGEGYVETPLGRLAAATQGRTGTGEIMLRPEQIVLEVASGDAEGGCRATVGRIEFAGPTSIVSVVLEDESFGGKRLEFAIRQRSDSGAKPGERVSVRVRGDAHLF
jgi:iron(III) transport system ATP-binding protein